MIQEDKALLLKDLCARLPYGLKVKCEKYSFPVTILYGGNIDEVKFIETGGIENICAIKPYLFPISSMTEEQSKVYHELINGMFGTSALINFEVLTDFFNANHLDYRGLIKKGLAIDATNLNIYYLGRVNK